MKHCKDCQQTKPFDATAKPGSKASGFYGRRCWDCYCKVNAAKSNKYYHENSKELNMRPKTPARAEHYRKKSLRRRYHIKQVQPNWANKQAIARIYALRAELTRLTGKKYVVDHIVPLKGQLVSGLHVENNLQVVPWDHNSKKSNKFEVEIDPF